MMHVMTPAMSARNTELPSPARLDAALLNERLPRYTSYPTAPHFSPDITASRYATWLALLGTDLPVSLYLHVPFCEALCSYCGCHTTVTQQPDRIARYADLLQQEIALGATAIGRRQPVTHIHWGGGTPTAIAPADFVAISRLIAKRFVIAPDAEIAIEIDPRHFDEMHAAVLVAAGVNRASLGVQDFDPTVQKAIGRIQSFEQTARTVELLRGIGIAGISFDLMYGLPYQTAKSVAASVHKALALDPTRLSLFGYAHVPWMKKHQTLIPEAALPNADARVEQMRAATEALIAAGYVAIGLDHFAKPDDPLARTQAQGRLHRNFQGYTTDAAPALIGFGASSIGYLPQGYVQNTPNLKTYREAIESGVFATARGICLSNDDRTRRSIIERLMCDLTVDLARYSRDPATTFSTELNALYRLASEGLIVINRTRITVPETMRPLIRKICAVFDRYLVASETRHSRAG
jgi:oxygen-independent coproporphyrinogen III oxidase